MRRKIWEFGVYHYTFPISSQNLYPPSLSPAFPFGHQKAPPQKKHKNICQHLPTCAVLTLRDLTKGWCFSAPQTPSIQHPERKIQVQKATFTLSWEWQPSTNQGSPARMFQTWRSNIWLRRLSDLRGGGRLRRRPFGGVWFGSGQFCLEYRALLNACWWKKSA